MSRMFVPMPVWNMYQVGDPVDEPLLGHRVVAEARDLFAGCAGWRPRLCGSTSMNEIV